MRRRLAAAVLVTVVFPLGSGGAEERKAESPGLETYCKAVADAVREREFAQKQQELEGLKAEINDKIVRLEALKGEAETWSARREEFARQAREGLVAIYLRMKPDAAAAQMGEMASELAAAILMKMGPRQAGLVLAEMPAAKAAQISGIMAAASQTDQPT